MMKTFKMLTIGLLLTTAACATNDEKFPGAVDDNNANSETTPTGNNQASNAAANNGMTSGNNGNNATTPPELELPEIGTFEVTSTVLAAGAPIEFSWEITSATPVRCNLDVNGDSVADYMLEDCLAVTTQEHTFQDEGTYTVTLSVENDDGVAQAQLDLTIERAPLYVTSLESDGPGTLRDQVRQAEEGDTILFDLGTNAQVILQEEVTVDKNLTICGEGPRDTTLDGVNMVRHFRIAPGTTVLLCDMTLQNGLTELIQTDPNFDTMKAQEGGSIHADGRDTPIDLTLRNMVLKDNNAYTEEPNRTFDSGGAVWLRNGTLTVESSTFENNFAASGGAISAFAEVTISDSVFRNNESLNPGGALQIIGSADIFRSSFIGNVGGTGGGAMIIEYRPEKRPGPRGDGSSVIVNSSFFQNSTPAGGGAIFSYTTLTVINSTFFDNTANSDDPFNVIHGGAIYQRGDRSDVDYTLVVRNSVIYGNTSPEGPDIKGEVEFEGVNYIGDLTDTVAVSGTPVVGDPLIAGLQNYTSLPPVVEVTAQSPAVDAVPVEECIDWDGTPLTVDQLGNPRPVGAGCDAGAVEIQ